MYELTFARDHMEGSPSKLIVQNQVVEDLKPIDNDADLIPKSMETVIHIEVERKSLKQASPPSAFIDDSYLKEALKRLGG